MEQYCLEIQDKETDYYEENDDEECFMLGQESFDWDDDDTESDVDSIVLDPTFSQWSACILWGMTGNG